MEPDDYKLMFSIAGLGVESIDNDWVYMVYPPKKDKYTSVDAYSAFNMRTHEAYIQYWPTATSPIVVKEFAAGSDFHETLAAFAGIVASIAR